MKVRHDGRIWDVGASTTIGNWDELKHDGGKFTGFAPARGMGLA